MKLKLNKYWTEYLLKYPERGMGYQRIDVLLKSGEIIKDIVVLNAEELLLPDQYTDLKTEEITNLIVLTKGEDKIF